MKKTIIDSNFNFLKLDLKELFQFKDLFVTLTYREYRVRYAQTILGFLWALLQPLATLIIFTFVFGKAIKVQTDNIPYPVFAMCGISIWTYFSFVISQAGKSLINSQSMIQKIYFPRIILPLSRAFIGFIDFFITLILLFILIIYYDVSISPNIVFFPFFIFVAIIAALGFGIWISALTVRFRDFQQIIPFIIQIGLYSTPIAYSALYISKKYHLIYYCINPMVGVVEGFRWCFFGYGEINHYTFYSILIVFLVFVSSVFYFKKVEKIMADII